MFNKLTRKTVRALGCFKSHLKGIAGVLNAPAHSLVVGTSYSPKIYVKIHRYKAKFTRKITVANVLMNSYRVFKAAS